MKKRTFLYLLLLLISLQSSFAMQNDSGNKRKRSDHKESLLAQTSLRKCFTCNRSFKSRFGFTKHFNTKIHQENLMNLKKLYVKHRDEQPVSQEGSSDSCDENNQLPLSDLLDNNPLGPPEYPFENLPWSFHHEQQNQEASREYCEQPSYEPQNLPEAPYDQTHTQTDADDAFVASLLAIDPVLEEFQEILPPSSTHQLSTSSKKAHICTICNIPFAQSNSLKNHERIHRNEKPFKCDTCGKSFVQAATLTNHERTHGAEKPFNCSICGKSFTQSGNLTRHERIHSNEKPFKCTICDKSFISSSDLKRHKRTHSGKKTFKCTTCDKAFARSDDLKSHERIHRDDKPFKCDICDKAFKQSSGLSAHKKRAHTDERS